MWRLANRGLGVSVDHFIPFIITCVVVVFCSSITKSFKNPFLADRPSCQFVAARCSLAVLHGSCTCPIFGSSAPHEAYGPDTARSQRRAHFRGSFLHSQLDSFIAREQDLRSSAVITSIISSKHFGVTGVPTATAIDADVVAAIDIVHKPHRRLQLPGG